MARCNLFKPISNPTGEFLMFSQFADDIAKQSTDGVSYRVTPSKFACMKLNTSGMANIDDEPLVSTEGYRNSYNIAIPKVFQNYFENAIATIKERLAESGKEWKPTYVNNILWRTLYKYGLIGEPVDISGDSYLEYYYDELKYVGDIPFYNNRDKDNITYNEIYCHIPVSAPLRHYYLETGTGASLAYDAKSTTMILGWNFDNYPTNTNINLKPLLDADDKYNFVVEDEQFTATSGETINIPQELYQHTYQNPTYADVEPNVEAETDQFQFNAIIVFYDIYNNSDQSDPVLIYKNIPLGIYFTGPVDDTREETERPFKNIVTKYVSNVDAFGQGSSYGLRIMTRFIPVPNSQSYYTEIHSGEDVASLATMMGELGDTISAMRSAIRSANSIDQDIKDHLAMFKNYRVNVPYIRIVNDVPTWFVNGRNTGRAAADIYHSTIDNILRRLAYLESMQTGEDWEEIYNMLRYINDNYPDGSDWDGNEPVDPSQTLSDIKYIND